tara:strand:+ start:498 stop:1271 length:774 start_codon:yes stop_codon:yes gene_type:complete
MSCEKVEPVVETYPLSEVEFSFLQASNKLYISAKALNKYQNSSLDSIMVLWQGTNITNTADTIKLIDDGTLGDLIPKDEIFSRKINNSSLYLKNTIPSSAKDSVFLSILGQYDNKELVLTASFILGNIRPKLTSVTGVQDTITKPSYNTDPNIINTIEFSLMATVSDPNGLDDIKRVFFRSYNVDLDSMMFNGDPVFLHDDGTGVDGSGDLQKGDGTYTRTISMTQDAKSGTYHWSFEAQDFSNAYSDTIKKIVVVK